MEQLLQVGVITQPHGVRGEVKVFPTTDDPVRFKKLKKVILDTGKEKLDLEVEHVKFFKQFVIVKFKEFDNIISVNFLQLRNAVSPISVTLFEIIILVKLSQFSNAEFPITITLFGIVILVKSLQS